MSAERLWQAALGQLQVEMPRATFDTWVRDAELLAHEDGAYIIGVQNAYARDWLEDRILATVKRVLTGLAGRTVEVRLVGPTDSLRQGPRTRQHRRTDAPVGTWRECYEPRRVVSRKNNDRQ